MAQDFFGIASAVRRAGPDFFQYGMNSALKWRWTFAENTQRGAGLAPGFSGVGKAVRLLPYRESRVWI